MQRPRGERRGRSLGRGGRMGGSHGRRGEICDQGVAHLRNSARERVSRYGRAARPRGWTPARWRSFRRPAGRHAAGSTPEAMCGHRRRRCSERGPPRVRRAPRRRGPRQRRDAASATRRSGRAGRARISVARCAGSGGSESVAASDATGASSLARAAADSGLSSGLSRQTGGHRRDELRRSSGHASCEVGRLEAVVRAELRQRLRRP